MGEMLLIKTNNNMKKFFISIILCVLTIGCKNDNVTTYILLTYTPPQEIEYGVTSPKVTVKEVDYDNDSTAISSLTNRYKSQREEILKLLEKEGSQKSKADRDALLSIASETHTLIIFSHPEDFEVEEFMNKAQKYGIQSDELKKYTEENNLTVTFNNLD